MTNQLMLLLAALAIGCTPAIAAEATVQDGQSKPSNAATAATSSPTSDAIEAAATSTTPAVESNPASNTPVTTATPTATAAPAATTSATSSPTATSTTTSPAAVVPAKANVSTSPAGNATPTVLTGSAKVIASTIPSEVSPGPYENDRKNVRNWLLEAKKRGVGLQGYIPVWEDMEASVKAKEPDATVKAKLDKICKNIGDQVKNSSTIQRFRPKKPKPNPDEDVEIIRVKWIGEKGSDPIFRDKADKWYNNAVDMLNPDQRADPLMRRRLHDQRDIIYKEMSTRYASGEKRWAPRLYKNFNQDLSQNYNPKADSPSRFGNYGSENADVPPMKNKH